MRPLYFFIALILFVKNKKLREILLAFKDQGLNKFKKYGDNYLSRIKEGNTIESLFIERKTKDILLLKITGVRDHVSRKIYMFLLAEPYRCDILEDQLKEIVKYTHLENKKIIVDFKKYSKDRKKRLSLSMISLVLMLISIFVFISYTPSEFKLSTIYCFMIITELSWLWFYYKLPNKKKMKEYADKLRRIDASGFK
ncbi:hypothetical protein PSI22_15985 [Xenorhabdus sp. XENO-7]|uniref:Uncharacterized protein n=1 Tax=Xenorhabdus aichiensis TaxID=3025874 RepID=A0ABT5MA04_9GAMM|nr:hypothetical protein [Xenorhabdus aichiensis]MDC9623096.1 hypothetical protein [Xenorhabdus aichiensis]